jgi:hypothetical protein
MRIRRTILAPAILAISTTGSFQPWGALGQFVLALWPPGAHLLALGAPGPERVWPRGPLGQKRSGFGVYGQKRVGSCCPLPAEPGWLWGPAGRSRIGAGFGGRQTRNDDAG